MKLQCQSLISDILFDQHRELFPQISRFQLTNVARWPFPIYLPLVPGPKLSRRSGPIQPEITYLETKCLVPCNFAQFFFFSFYICGFLILNFFGCFVSYARGLRSDIVPRPPRKADDATHLDLRKIKDRRPKKKQSRPKSASQTWTGESFKPYTSSVADDDSRALLESLRPRSASALRRREKARNRREDYENIQQPRCFPVVQVVGSKNDRDGALLREAATILCEYIRTGNVSPAQAVRSAIDACTRTYTYSPDTYSPNANFCSLQLLENVPALGTHLNDVVYFIAKATTDNGRTYRRRADGMSVLMLGVVTENVTLCQELLSHGDEHKGRELAVLSCGCYHCLLLAFCFCAAIAAVAMVV